MTAPELESAFPELRQMGYRVASPATRDYNCIAWAASRDDEWWEPDPFHLYYWPERRRERSLEAFVRVFRSLGYQVCDSPELETGFEKVAIYAKGRAPKHMARQLLSGEWTSKCGKQEDITHTLEGLENSDYGTVAIVMRRSLSQDSSGAGR